MAQTTLKFWGVVGSSPPPCTGDRTFGMHTMCSGFESQDGDILIIDAGTGIIRLGDTLAARNDVQNLRIHCLFTHFHLDHILGLPFFKPLFQADAHIFFYSPWDPADTQAACRGLMGGRFFPLEFQETPSRKEFFQLGDAEVRIGQARVTWCPLNHPQGSTAYRLEFPDRSYVLATDTEPRDDGNNERLTEFCRGADYLICDAMFTSEDYARRKGWGHSTWLHAVELAAAAGVGTLFLSHLNPDYSDLVFENIQGWAQARFPDTYIAQEVT